MRDLHSSNKGIQTFRAAKERDRLVWERAMELKAHAVARGTDLDGLEARKAARIILKDEEAEAEAQRKARAEEARNDRIALSKIVKGQTKKVIVTKV